MNLPPSEVEKTRLLPLVLKVSLSHDLATVVVDIQDPTSSSVRHKNTLYFKAVSFSVVQVEAAIHHILFS